MPSNEPHGICRKSHSGSCSPCWCPTDCDHEGFCSCEPVCAAEEIKHYPTTLTKRQIKRAYLKAEIGLSDAFPALIFDHRMERSDAYKYLGF